MNIEVLKTDIEMFELSRVNRVLLTLPPSIQNFINTVKSADAGLAREVKLNIPTSKSTCIYIRCSYE